MTNRYGRNHCKWIGHDDGINECCLICIGYIESNCGEERCPFRSDRFGCNVNSGNLHLLSIEEKMLDIRTRKKLSVEIEPMPRKAKFDEKKKN